MPYTSMELTLPDAEATEQLGAALARAFPGAAEGAAALYLEGDLGAGKTTCVRSLLRALGATGLIRSPTYTLVEHYRLGALLGVHVDLYRLGGADQVDELGLRDVIGPGTLLLVEWPEKGAGVLPPPDLRLDLEMAGGGRHVRLKARGERGEAWLEKLRNDTKLSSYLSNLT